MYLNINVTKLVVLMKERVLPSKRILSCIHRYRNCFKNSPGEANLLSITIEVEDISAIIISRVVMHHIVQYTIALGK